MLLNQAITAGVLSGISDLVSQKLTGIQKIQLRRLVLKVVTLFLFSFYPNYLKLQILLKVSDVCGCSCGLYVFLCYWVMLNLKVSIFMLCYDGLCNIIGHWDIESVSNLKINK